MLDQIAGRPSPSWRRSQVILVLTFWLTSVLGTSRYGPRIFYLRRLNRKLSHLTPYQILATACAILYAVRHADVLLGLTAPDPLARLYKPNFFRASYIATALDAGFATAGEIKWKWLRDIASLVFAGYYLVFAQEAEEKLRRFRSLSSVDFLRVTWNKQSNPYIRFFTRRHRPPVKIHRKVFLPRPKGSRYDKPITALLFFNGTDLELASHHELIMDVPGGGFVSMTPEHHAERILRWARQTGRPVLSFDYGKAPEYPFPFAIDEIYEAYSLLHATKGQCIGMNTAGDGEFRVVLTGDSAGANIATAMVNKILETRPPTSPARKAQSGSSPAPSLTGSASSASSGSGPILPLPVALVFAYPALSFHFTSWMPSADVRLLRAESNPDLASLLRGKDHLDHKAPLSVVEDVAPRSASSERGRPKVLKRKRTTSWRSELVKGLPASMSFATLRRAVEAPDSPAVEKDEPNASDGGEAEEVPVTDDREKSLSERVLWWDAGGEAKQRELEGKVVAEVEKVRQEIEGTKEVKGTGLMQETKLTMTSRTAYYNDRIISPPMCRAMALCYIGPRNCPDLHSDYYISPIFTPPHLLAQFPPVYISCGERDPFVDDTIIFSGKLREAKEARKLEIKARAARHGEGLRMSSRTAVARDPILDETEDDWVTSKYVEGWSHGYLQMVSILPAVEEVIEGMAGWISEAFEKAEQKAQASRESSPPSVPAQVGYGVPASPTKSSFGAVGAGQLSPIVSAGPSGEQSRSSSPHHYHQHSPGSTFRPHKIMPPRSELSPSPMPTIGGGPALTPRITTPLPFAMEAEGEPESDALMEESMLTFTPKRRRGSSNVSRAQSPSQAGVPGGRPPLIQVASGSSGSGSGFTLPRSALAIPPSVASGDEASASPTPPTTASPAAYLRSPAEAELASPTPEADLVQKPHALPFHLVTPAERALRDELSTTLPVPSSSAKSRPFFTEPLNTPQPDQPSRLASPHPACYLDAAHPHGPTSRPPSTSPARGRGKTRTGSLGSLPEPRGAVFVDAKDLFRRRRDDVVRGITSSARASAAGSGSNSLSEESEGEVSSRRRKTSKERAEERRKRRIRAGKKEDDPSSGSEDEGGADLSRGRTV
ncbi:hypothetical protein JCM8097_009581 [Rhodosporidiobolus ruineniae]